VARIVLVTGGGRSGKSTYAQRLAQDLPGPRMYIATATPFDEELTERIAAHRRSRGEEHWPGTIEEPLALAQAIRDAKAYPSVLVDCLTVWVGNLMWSAEQASAPGGGPSGASPEAARSGGTRPGGVPAVGAPPSEASVASACDEIVAACREHEGTVVLVTNEVGLGIIPENPAARLYRDLLGRCNQVIAVAADTVILMVAGLPIVVKDEAGGATP
jgi:adenosylcobinamide kinase / adenosylcobinamide-phosphate guanylyltransferase